MKNFTFSLLPALFSFLFFTNNPTPDSQPIEEIKSYDLFEIDDDIARKSDLLTGGVYLDISKKTLTTLNDDRPQALNLAVPGDEEMLTLNLHASQVFEDDFVAKTHGVDGVKVFDYKQGLHYHGTIEGYPTAVVSVSVFDDWMMGVLSFGGQNYNLGPYEPEVGKFSDSYVLFKEKDMINPPYTTCGLTEQDMVDYVMPDIDPNSNYQRKMSAAVRSYIEADFRMYRDNGNDEQKTIDYVAAVYNEVAILYANEQILTRISEVKVWTMQDPYPAAGSRAILDAFTNGVTNFNGDLAHLFSTLPLSNGGIAWLDVLCSTARPHAYSNISNNFQPVPTFTFTVEVVTHEMGHNLGSPHTQGCRWGPSRNQALDDCVATEGSCSPGPTPTNGGTIMSYCHLARNIGINFENGFGQEPGDLVRSKVNNAPCLEDIFDCFSKINLEPGVTYEGSTADGGSTAFVDYSCTGTPHRGAEVAHKFESTVAGRAYITFSETAPEELNLFMMTECDPAKCDRFWEGDQVPLNDSFDVVPGVEYVFIVDTEEDAPGGDYELRISFPNATCATGAILEAGVMYAGTTRDGTSNVLDYGCSSDRYRGAEYGHAFTATEDGWAYIYFNEEIPEDMDLFILQQCDPSTCIKFINGGKDVRDSIPVANGQTYFFFVDVKEDSRGGDYNLLISFPGNGCFTTKTLTNGVTLAGNVSDGASNFINYSCTGASHGGDEVGHFFISPVPGEARVQFRDVQNRGLNLFLGKACNPDSCTQFWSGGTVDDDIQIEALTPYYFIVDKEATGGTGDYELTVTMLPSLDNCFCEEPTTDEICENFENWDLGPVTQSPCFSGDGQVSDGSSFNGDNALYINSGSTVLQLGNRLQGQYTLKFKQNVKLRKDGFWRVYHIYDPVNPANNVVAFEIEMEHEVTRDAPFMRLFAGDPFPASSTGSVAYNQEFYRDFVVNIDIDNDYAEMFYNGIALHQWDFSNTPHGTGAPPSIAAVEFFAEGTNTEYYVDNFQFIEDDGGFCLNSGALFCDDFDTYTQGASVPSPQTGTLWGLMDVPNDDTDPNNFSTPSLTSFDNSLSGLAALNVRAGIPGAPWNDIVSNFGVYNSGKIKKSFRLFVPSGANAHMNVLHSYFPNGDTADDIIGSYIYFDRAGSGVVVSGGTGYPFNFTPNEWIDYLQLVDFDKDETTVFIQGIPVATYPFSNLVNAVSPDPDLTNVWAGFNFSTFGRIAPGGQDNLARFLIENVELFDLSLYLNADPINVYLPATSGTETVTVNSNLPSWEAIEDSQWYTSSATGGPGNGTVTINYDANIGIETRTSEMIIKGNGAPPKRVNVIQDGALPVLSVTPNTSPITCAAIGETLNFTVSSNVFWSVTSSDDSWLIPDRQGGQDDGSFSIECLQNVGGFREDTITLFGQPAADIVIIVRQEPSGPAIATSTDTLCVPGVMGDTTYEILANVTWSIDADSWLTTNPSSGTDNATVNVSYQGNPTANTRYGEITMSGGGADAKSVVVKQLAVAPFLESDKLNFNVGIPPGMESFNINSNVDWTIKSSATWFTLDATSGSGNGTIGITYDENMGTVERIDTIRVCGSNGVADIEIIIRQEGAGNLLSATPLQIDLPASPAGSVTFDVMSNITWRAQTSSVWFDLEGGDRIDDMGNRTITLNYQENQTTQTRSDEITLTGSGAATVTITVTQDAAGAILCVFPADTTVDSNSGFIDFTVLSTVNNWMIDDDVSWLALDRANGGPGTITVRATYGENVAPTPRTATVTLTGPGMQPKTLVITQTGAGFIFNTDKQQICFPKTQSMEGFALTAPGLGWTISDDAAWLQVQPNSGFGNNGNIGVIALDNSGNPARTATITITEIGGGTSITIDIKQEGDAPPPTLDASPNPIMVTAPAGTNSFDVTANIDWTATSNDSWITSLDPTSGDADGTVTFDYQANPTPTPRTGTITLSGNGVAPDVTIEVIQEGLALDLTVTPDQITVPAPMGQASFRLTSNGDWTTMINDSWITLLTPSSGSATDEDILVDYEENTGTTARTGTIDVMLTGTNITRTVTITQEAAGLFLTTDPQTINVTAPAGIESFSVMSNTNWTYSTTDSWIRLGTSPSGSDSETKNFDYDENTDFNARTGNITVSAPGLPDQNIVVIQEGAGPILMADQTVFNVSAPAGSEQVMVTANIDWGAVSIDPSWLNVSPATGNGDGMLNITFDENTSSMGRTGTIELSGSQGATTIIITVNQAGAGVTFDVSQTSFNIDRVATVETVDLMANVDWTAKTSDSWIVVTPTSGTGDATISMAITDNPDTSPRTGTVTICSQGQPDIVITINQDGVARFVDADPITINAPQPASTEAIMVTSNTDWTIKTSDSWLTLSTSDGTGDGTVTVNIMENPDLDPRVGTITICSQGLDDVVITVNQAGLQGFLMTNPTVINVTSDNGTESFDVMSNVDWEICDLPTWMSANPVNGSGNGTVVITYSPNADTSPRSGTIKICATGLPDAEVVINQEGAAAPFLTVSPLVIDVPASPAGSRTFTVESNVTYEITKDGSNWFQVSPEGPNQNGNQTITVNYDPNTGNIRTGEITISAAGLQSQVVTVTQEGVNFNLDVDQTDINLTQPMGSNGFEITSNIDWQISENSGGWIESFNMTNGNGNESISFNYMENTGFASRSAVITVSGNGVPDRRINVTQEGLSANLTVSTNDISVDAPAGQTSFDITSNVSWNITTGGAGWFTVNPPNGMDDQTIEINYDANPSATPRSAVITVMGGGITEEITITQGIPMSFLTASPDRIILPSPAGNDGFDIISNVDWTIDIPSNATWISAQSALIGTGPGRFDFDYTANTDANVRSTIVTISGNGITEEVEISQQGTISPYLELDRTGDIPVNNTSGTEVINVMSNVDWEVTSDASWARIINGIGTANGVFVVQYSANSDSSPRVATITARGMGVQDVVVTITQDGFDPRLEVSQDVFNVGPFQGTVEFDISSNITWSINSNVPWADPSATALGSNNQTVMIPYQTNPNPGVRTATLLVQGSGLSRTVTIIQSEANSVEDMERLYQLSLFPNPTSDMINVQFDLPSSELLTIDVIDMTGRIVERVSEDILPFGKHRLTKQVGTLSSGMYILRFRSKLGVITKRFMVN